MKGDEIMKEFKYTLSFNDAMKILFLDDSCLDKGFVVGNNFKPGVFLAVDENTGCVIIRELTDNGYITLGNLTVTEGILKQLFRTILVANKESLGLE